MSRFLKFFAIALLCLTLGPTGAQELVTVDDVVAAASQFELHAVRKLLKQNPSAINEVGTAGESPLTACILAKTGSSSAQAKLDCIRFLLDQGADPNLRVGDIAPLELAMIVDIEIVRILLNAGADPTDPADDGLTPIGTAEGLKGDNAEQIRELLRNAAKKS